MAVIRAKVTIRGTRTLIQHHFGPDAIPLEKEEKTGVAGNNPEEWKKTRMVDGDGRLFVLNTYVFGCLKNGAVHTKKGRGSLQAPLVATLEVEEEVIYLNRKQPAENELTKQSVLSPADPNIKTFIYVASVKNPATKGRNVRYRLATRAGWKCEFTLRWDNTIISREQMKAILRDAGTFGGLGDGIKIGAGRFEVVSYEELTDAQEEATEGTVGRNHKTEDLDKGRRKVPAVR